MAKRDGKGSKGGGRKDRQDAKAAKRRAELERRIAAADKLISRRVRQLDEATAEKAALTVQLGTLLRGGTDAATETVEAFCLRERARVTVLDARPVVLPNGRHALEGSCASCGAKVVRLVAAASVAQPAAH